MTYVSTIYNAITGITFTMLQSNEFISTLTMCLIAALELYNKGFKFVNYNCLALVKSFKAICLA